MGFLISHCSSRALPMFLRAPPAALATNRRLSHATPAPKPIAPPSRPNANTLPRDLRPDPGQLPSTPRHAPSAAGLSALRTDSLRKGARDSPLRNSSPPERAPLSPELTSFSPYSAFDFDHSRKSIGDPRRTRL